MWPGGYPWKMAESCRHVGRGLGRGGSFVFTALLDGSPQALCQAQGLSGRSKLQGRASTWSGTGSTGWKKEVHCFRPSQPYKTYNCLFNISIQALRMTKITTRTQFPKLWWWKIEIPAVLGSSCFPQFHGLSPTSSLPHHDTHTELKWVWAFWSDICTYKKSGSLLRGKRRKKFQVNEVAERSWTICHPPRLLSGKWVRELKENPEYGTPSLSWVLSAVSCPIYSGLIYLSPWS